MAEEIGRKFQRFVVDGATIEFQTGGIFRRGGVQTGHVLNFSRGGIQVLCSEQVELKEMDKLGVVVHLRNRRNFLKADVEVRWYRKVPNRPFKRFGARFDDLEAEQNRLLRDLEREYLPIQEGETRGRTAKLSQDYKIPKLETPRGQKPRDVEAAVAAERARFGLETKEVQRPVALLELIGLLENFEVTPELVVGLLEAAEQDVTVEQLFDIDERPEVRPRRRVAKEERPREDAKPMPVYRLDGKAPIHFSEEGVPVTPPVDHLYFTRMAEEACFAGEVTDDRMTQDGQPSFRPGDIVVFGNTSRAENGSFVFVKMRNEKDEFTQIFFGRDDHIRLRPLNGNYQERSARRADVLAMFKVIARLEQIR